MSVSSKSIISLIGSVNQLFKLVESEVEFREFNEELVQLCGEFGGRKKSEFCGDCVGDCVKFCGLVKFATWDSLLLLNDKLFENKLSWSISCVSGPNF